MKKETITVKVLTALLISSLPAVAGINGVNDWGATKGSATTQSIYQKVMEKINTTCKLTAEEKEKVQPFVKELIQTRVENAKKYNGHINELKSADMSSNHSFREKMKAVLTENQLKALNVELNKDEQNEEVYEKQFN